MAISSRQTRSNLEVFAISRARRRTGKRHLRLRFQRHSDGLRCHGRALARCGARIDQVDQAAKELKLLPPFISFDSWKPSIVEDVTRIMAELRGDTFLRSSPLLGRLAKDNPRFYVDQQPNPKIYELAQSQGKTLDDDNVKRALKTSMLVAAARVAELGETPATVEFVATEGIKMPRPPLKQIDATGAAAVRQELERTNRLLGETPLVAPAILVEMTGAKKTFHPETKE